MKFRPQHRSRPGLTLLEVIVSMAIFLFSMVAIWQLAALGSDRALDVKLQSRTSLCCQAKLDEIISTVSPAAGSGYTNYGADTGNSDLQWMADVQENEPNPGLMTVTVAVKATLENGKIVESKLSRLILDPSTRGSTQDVPNTPATPNPTQDAATPSNGKSSGGSGNQGSGGGVAAGSIPPRRQGQ